MTNPMTYLVTAYRYGDINDTYVVYAGADREKASSYAEREANNRGGKYGLEVAECIEGPEEMEFKPIRYIPSDMGEKAPALNHRPYIYMSLGMFAYAAAIERTVSVPDADKRYMVPLAVEPPDWLVRRAAQAKADLEYWHPTA